METKPICTKSNSIVVLFDSTSSLEELKNFLKQNKPKTIITFDYDSHKLLLKNGIKHEISDSYLNERDIKLIDEKSHDFSKWGINPKLKMLLDYDGINLGHLFIVEFHYYLVPILKKFFEIIKIYKKYKQQNFLAPSILYKIIKSFTDSANHLSNSNFSETMLYDVMKYEYKILNKPIKINLSSKNYFKFKETSEKIIHFLFAPQKNAHNSKKNTFLVEFNTLKYSPIFFSLSQSNLKLVIYNRKRPSIWNFETFSIIKKSHCHIATRYAVDKNELKNAIDKGEEQLKNKFEYLWNDQNFFKSFFSLDGFSFWDIIKSTFTQLCEKRMNQAITEIELTKNLLEKIKPTSISVLSENGFIDQIVINLAKKLTIPVILLQHGVFNYPYPGVYEHNKFFGVYPFNVDKFAIWGNSTKQHLLDCGFPSSKLVIIGSPQCDKFFDRLKRHSNIKKNYVLLATSAPSKYLANDLTVKTNDLYEETIKKICEVVTKMGKKLIIKLHPDPKEIDITYIAKKINPGITIVQHEEILPLIESCEIMLVIDISTTILEAQIFKKPVISLSVKDYGFGNPKIFNSESVISTDKNNFESILKRVLNDEEFKQKLIEKANKTVDDTLSNQGMASKTLVSFLEKL